MEEGGGARGRCSVTSGSHSLHHGLHILTYLSRSESKHKLNAHGCTQTPWTRIRDSVIRTQERPAIHHVTDCVEPISCLSPRAPRETCQGQRDDRHARDWFRGLSLIILCRRLNCLLKSNYQAVCVAYKIGAASRGGEDWKGWGRDSTSRRRNTLSGWQIWGIFIEGGKMHRKHFALLSSHQIAASH